MSKKKKTKGLLTRLNSIYFVAYQDEDRDLLSKIPIGGQVAFNVSDTRSVGYHRRYFAMLTAVIHLMPEALNKRYGKPERIITEIKDILGMYEQYEDIHGQIKKEYDSMSFIGMGQKRFEKFYKDSCDIILQTFLRDITLEDFNKYLQGLM